MRDFVNDRWRAILAHNGLSGFDALWNLKAGWFEEPNRRRGGWSGVSRCELKLPEGGSRAVFVKRQENHPTFSWRHPFAGIPTFEREFKRILRYRACGIPALEPVYSAMRQDGKDQRAILITEELTGFAPLNGWLAASPRPLRLRLACIESVAALLAAMHRHGIQHNCFFPKHVFVRETEAGSIEPRVIDLEKSRWRPLKTLCALRDLDTLNRYSTGWSRADRLRFLKAYLGIERLTPYGKWLWRRLTKRALRKARGKTA